MFNHDFLVVSPKYALKKLDVDRFTLTCFRTKMALFLLFRKCSKGIQLYGLVWVQLVWVANVLEDGRLRFLFCCLWVPLSKVV